MNADPQRCQTGFNPNILPNTLNIISIAGAESGSATLPTIRYMTGSSFGQQNTVPGIPKNMCKLQMNIFKSFGFHLPKKGAEAYPKKSAPAQLKF